MQGDNNYDVNDINNCCYFCYHYGHDDGNTINRNNKTLRKEQTTTTTPKNKPTKKHPFLLCIYCYQFCFFPKIQTGCAKACFVLHTLHSQPKQIKSTITWEKQKQKQKSVYPLKNKQKNTRKHSNNPCTPEHDKITDYGIMCQKHNQPLHNIKDPWRWNVTTSVVGLKKGHIHKYVTKMVNSRGEAGKTKVDNVTALYFTVSSTILFWC